MKDKETEREREERAVLPVVISKIAPVHARKTGGRGSFVRRFAKTENKIIYPPTRVRVENACSIAESSIKKEKETFFGGSVVRWEATEEDDSSSGRGLMSIAARMEERVTVKRTR